MQDAMGKGESVVVVGRESSRRAKKRTNEHCSICTNRIRYDAVHLMEPDIGPAEIHQLEPGEEDEWRAQGERAHGGARK